MMTVSDNFTPNVPNFERRYWNRFTNWMHWACLLIVRDAKERLKPWTGEGEGGVDTGRLRRSIAYEVVSSFIAEELTGKVGTSVNYARFIEFGTRRHLIPAFSNDPKWIGVKRWCERHGIQTGWLEVGRAYPFLTPALRAKLPEIKRKLEEVARL